MTSASDTFNFYRNRGTDLHCHLQRLYESAKGNILEIGVRDGVSTSAFLTGVGERGGRVYSIDIVDCSQLFATNWSFCQGDSMNVELPSDWPATFDLVFIDGNHDYSFVLSDLERFGTLSNRIFCHDYEFSSVSQACSRFIDLYPAYKLTVFPGSFGLAVLER